MRLIIAFEIWSAWKTESPGAAAISANERENVRRRLAPHAHLYQ
jgi:hypothetical protein